MVVRVKRESEWNAVWNVLFVTSVVMTVDQ